MRRTRPNESVAGGTGRDSSFFAHIAASPLEFLRNIARRRQASVSGRGFGSIGRFLVVKQSIRLRRALSSADLVGNTTGTAETFP